MFSSFSNEIHLQTQYLHGNITADLESKQTSKRELVQKEGTLLPKLKIYLQITKMKESLKFYSNSKYINPITSTFLPFLYKHHMQYCSLFIIQ